MFGLNLLLADLFDDWHHPLGKDGLSLVNGLCLSFVAAEVKLTFIVEDFKLLGDTVVDQGIDLVVDVLGCLTGYLDYYCSLGFD